MRHNIIIDSTTFFHAKIWRESTRLKAAFTAFHVANGADRTKDPRADKVKCISLFVVATQKDIMKSYFIT